MRGEMTKTMRKSYCGEAMLSVATVSQLGDLYHPLETPSRKNSEFCAGT